MFCLYAWLLVSCFSRRRGSSYASLVLRSVHTMSMLTSLTPCTSAALIARRIILLLYRRQRRCHNHNHALNIHCLPHARPHCSLTIPCIQTPSLHCTSHYTHQHATGLTASDI